jgi:DNA-binding XRE family transcriptional regulator
MSRTSKDPNHPITKLRRQLSTHSQPLTRQMFAERYGFSAETLKALETGKYKLSPRVALKIAVAVGVDARSLLKNENPLLTWKGQPVTPETKPALRDLYLNTNERLEFLVKAAFNAARKHSKGDRSALFVLLFDYWLADVTTELGVGWEFWDELWRSTDRFKLGAKPSKARRSKTQRYLERYLERPQEVRITDYGFHDAVARGLARPAMLDAEEKRLLLEYLTPAEVAEYDVPINWKLADSGSDPKFGAPQRIAYERFAKAKGIDPLDQEAVGNAFRTEAHRRLREKEENWVREQEEWWER